MSAPASRPLRQPEQFGRLWWLPSDGQGNGLNDTAWAPLAIVDAGIVPALLAELRAAGVPAFAAPVTRRPTHHRQSGLAEGRCHLLVGTSRYSQAEETLRVQLPVLLRQAR
jgi:hypothetical protein